MSTRALVVATAFVVAAIFTGCARTTPGTVALTTEPGGSISTSTPRTTTSSPRTSPPETSSDVPPPSDAASITCEDYLALDEANQTAVIEEILAGESSVLGPGDADIAKTLADAVCTFLPTSQVSEILTGGGPP